MKKILCIFLILSLVIACMTGCNENKQQQSQTPTQATKPIGNNNNQQTDDAEEPTTDNASEFKYESEHLQVFDCDYNGKVKQLCGDYFIDSEGQAHYVWRGMTGNIIFTSDGTDPDGLDNAEKLISGSSYSIAGYSDAMIGLKEGYKLYLSGNSSYYYNPEYKDLAFLVTGYGLFVFSQKADGTLVLQSCYTDGTFYEEQIVLKSANGIKNPNFKDFVDLTDINEIRVISDVGFIVIDNNGNLHYFDDFMDDEDEDDNTTTLHGNYVSVVFDRNASSHDDQLSGVSKIFNNDPREMIYAKINNESSLFVMVDWDKNESTEIKLPNDYKVNDIARIYDYYKMMLVVFNDGSVYIANTDKSYDLNYIEDLSKIHLEVNAIHNFGGQTCVLMDDGNIYKVIFDK